MAVPALTVLLIECPNGMTAGLKSALGKVFPTSILISRSSDETADPQLRHIDYDAAIIAAAAWDDEVRRMCRSVRREAKWPGIPVLLHAESTLEPPDQLNALESGITMILEGTATDPLLLARLSAVLKLSSGDGMSRAEPADGISAAPSGIDAHTGAGGGATHPDISHAGMHHDEAGLPVSVEQLRRSEERYRQLFVNMRQGFALHEIILDDAGQPIDYRFLSVNPAFEKLTGLAATDIIGKTVREVMPATEAEWIKKYGEVALGGSDIHFADFAGELGRYYEVWAFSPESMKFAVLFNDSTERFQYEAMLRESEQRFREMMVLAPVAYQSLGPDGRILDVNDTLSEMLGYSPEELTGKYYGDLFSEDTRDQFPARFSQFVSGQVSSGDLALMHASGKVLDVYFNGRRQRDVNGNLERTHCVLTDITERKHAERALRKSEALYRALFEDHGAAKFILDTEAGRIVDANQAAADFYGWSRDELRCMRIHDINTMDDVGIDILIADVINNPRDNYEYQHRLKDGSIRDVEILAGPIEIDGKVLLHTVTRDITERKRAEKQLRLLGQAMQHLPVCVIITDADANITYVNPQVSILTGYSEEEVLGNNPRMFQSGLHEVELYEEMWSTILSGKDWFGEMCNRNKNDALYWERAIISPLLDEDGSISNFIGLKLDITEQKRIMDELVAAKEKAEEGDRLKSAFLANMSHEVRTPMNAIMGFSDLLHEGDLSADTQKDYTSMIWQRSRDLLQIMDDILNIALLDAGQARIQKSPCNIVEMLDDIFTLFQHLLEHEKSPLRLNYQNDLPTTEFVMETDEGRLRQIIGNLLSNAIKFTHEGHVTLGCRLRETGDVLFSVEDTGIGIPLEARTSVFDRFTQVEMSTPRPYGGNGLGLSISKGYVDLLGGEIWFESEIGHGTTFFFTLPHA